MSLTRSVNLGLVLALSLIGCQLSSWITPKPTPLPGWQTSVYPLLLDDDSFPEGWSRIRTAPATPETGPPPNHVGRSWWWEAQGDGKATQAIWRSYTVALSEEWYDEMRESLLQENRTPRPPDYFVPYKTPEEIDFQSETADEWRLACGFWLSAGCVYVARYRNYVTAIEMEREANHAGIVTQGLTYAEIESVIRAADRKFAEAIEDYYESTP